MKLKRLYKTFSLLLLLAASTIFAQDNLRASKFDEFNIFENPFHSNYDEITVSQRAERFAKQLKKEREAKAYIIYYQARINNSFAKNRIEYQASRVKQSVLSATRFEHDDITTIDGGYRENAAFELWVVPKNAALPKPTPTLDKSETYLCPNIYINNNSEFNNSETLKFSVSAYDFRGLNEYSLTWKVSAGEIIDGQGFNSVKVRLNNSAPKRVTAFLEVSGLPLPCQKVFSSAAEIGGKLFLLDSFENIPSGDTKARLDAFLHELQKNPTAKGYIIIYGNRTEGNRDVVRKDMFYRNYLRFRNFDTSRIIIVDGGFREKTSGELWLSFDDAVQPIPTPTVDRKFVAVPVQTRKSRRR
jgi:hypothetical protein